MLYIYSQSLLTFHQLGEHFPYVWEIPHLIEQRITEDNLINTANIVLSRRVTNADKISYR